MKYTIWKCEDESPYVTTAFKVKDTSSIKEASVYFESIESCIIIFFDPFYSDRSEVNANNLQDISEQLFEPTEGE
jgi:hypothetical protein